MRKNTKGFGVVEIILVIIIIILLSVLGWIFLSKQMNSKPNSENTSSTQQAQDKEKSQAKPVAEKPVYTLDNAVTDINKTLSSASCNGSGRGQVTEADFTQVDNSAQFNYQSGKNIIDDSLTYAFTQYGCGSQGSIGLLKKSSSGWVLVSEDARMYPMCAKIRGQNFPTSIIDKCYVDDNATEPVKI